MNKLLANALLLDTETLGIQRGAGVHELAVYDLGTGVLNEFLLTPNMVQTQAATKQEHTRLATSAQDVHRLVEASSWQDIIKQQLVIDKHLSASASPEEVGKALQAASPWLAKRLETYPHLLGKIESSSARQERQAQLKRAGVRGFTSETISPKNLLAPGGKLEQAIQGKTIWGANIAFDAKAVGSLIGGLEAQGSTSTLKRSLETHGPTVDPFYVTGVEVNKARVVAQQTGDWTGVWKAYNQFTPKAGETAVRDIQDVLRGMMSYGQKLGLLGEGDVYWGTSLDTVYKLMGADDPSILAGKETHRAAEDLAIHSKTILEKAVDWTSKLEQAHERGVAGLDLTEVATYFKRLEHVKPQLRHENLIKRLGRAQMDFLEKGETWQVDGWQTVNHLTQQTPGGGSVRVPMVQSNRIRQDSLDQVVQFLNSQGRYGPEINIAEEATRMQQAIGGGQTKVDQKRMLNQYLEERTSAMSENYFAKESEVIRKTVAADAGATVTRARRMGKMIGEAAGALPHARGAALLSGWGAFAGAMATGGMVWSMWSGNAQPTRDQPSLVTYNYKEWLSRQAEFSGQRDPNDRSGMSEQGMAGALRKSNTDFGSPYQGIMGSQVVFYEQEMLREREKWLREQYGAVHYDPVSGLFGMQGILTRARHKGYAYIPDGTAVQNGYANLKGNHLMKINLGDGKWKMKVDDADTIVLQRGGLRGALGGIFGLNKSYTFRMSGIDAPEVAHNDGLDKYHAEQPGGRAGAAGFAAMLASGQNLELVYNPTDTTYGRALGVVLAEGKNLNYEVVRRGHAAFLPFGKEENDMQRWGPLKSMQDMAVRSSRGMWQHPYFKAYHDATMSSGDSITFNTFTQLDKIVAKQSTMDILSLMEQAQARGQYSAADAVEATRIGSFTHRGPDHVQPVVTGQAAAHYNSYLHEALSDTATWSKTHGTGMNPNRHSRRGGYGSLDKALVLDSMGHTSSVWSRRRLAAYERYDTGKMLDTTRKVRMAAAQRGQIAAMGQSHQKHSQPAQRF